VIRLVVALAREARPLIARYQLEATDSGGAFRTFRREEVSLVISGPGKEAAAAATRYLHSFCGGGRDRAWINVGIGGHPTYPVGQAILAHKIVDSSTTGTFYPPLVIPRSCLTGEVLTVEKPEDRYEREAVYEMEAAGFYREATRFSTAELVQVVKIVSDNRELSWKRLSASSIEDLVGARLEEISTVIEETAGLARELAKRGVDPPEYAQFLERWHFTVTERRRLRELFQRLRVLAPEKEAWSPELHRLPHAEAVLRWLERRLESAPIRIR